MAPMSTVGVSASSGFPSDAEILAILADRIDVQRQSLGIVVGMTGPAGRHIVAHGRHGEADARPVNGGTLFEIGSVTKVFTALLLADMVRRGEAALSDPVADYLPEGAAPGRRAGRAITLIDLATHTSALPSLPDDFAPEDPGNPYADYSFAQLFGFLARHELTRDIGVQYDYSNLGFGLLGEALARRAGTTYEDLVRSRITGPLGMTSTMVTLSDEARTRLAGAHDAALRGIQHWDLPTFAGAGALRSTASDMLTFLEAALGHRDSPLAPAFAAMLEVRRPMGVLDMQTALGWMVVGTGDDTLVWHNGGTGGQRSFAGYLVKARTGVVALSNSSAALGVDDIGRHLLDPAMPLAPPAKQRVAVAVAPEVLARHVGRYRLTPDMILAVTQVGGRLFVQATGQPDVEVFAESDTDFFTVEVDAQLSFEIGGEGRAVRAVLHQGGQDMPAERIED
ncbi:MAG: serine hydrolase [Rhizobiales bacterium]|nr:serine hydrolase [Hyphomicrobiales bacterium]